jgi:CheY-like chemotaxis protein
MSKLVIDCGNCAPDHAAIRRLIESRFAAKVVQTENGDETLQRLETGRADLILVNRKLDCDYSDGLEVIRLLKAHPQWKSIPVMLITNYAEHQQAAVDLGALPGFGKLSLNDPATAELLHPLLGST